MEPVNRFSSPWTYDSSPLPSPGPPPSPAVWDWQIPRKEMTPSRSLPLIPSGHEMRPAMRTNTTISPLPTHPEFLHNLQLHPMIVHRGQDLFRTPSPASSTSTDYMFPTKPEEKPTGPVPFPMSSGPSTPVMCASPRPIQSGSSSSQGSVHSLPSYNPSPARTPDSAIALSTPLTSRAFTAVPPPPPLPPQLRPGFRPQTPSQAQSRVQAQAQAPALPQLQMPSQQAQQQVQPQVPFSLKAPPAPKRKAPSPPRVAVAAPRPRVPALGGSTGPAQTVMPARVDSMEVSAPRHPLFYLQEGMIVLKVERSLYKVHKYLLEHHTDFFRGWVSDGPDSIGHSDERPLPLPENVSQHAFDCLLSFLYAGIYDPASLSLPDWITLLRVSTTLRFKKVRAYAIRELTARCSLLAAIDTIVLAREHDIPSWLGPAYAELIRRASPLDDDEAERLGARTTAQVGRAREILRAEEFTRHQQRRYGASYAITERPDEQLVARAVNDVFGLDAGALGTSQ